MKRELIFTKKKSDEIYRLPHEKFPELNSLAVLVKENYDFEVGYVPEGYGVSLLMIKDDEEDSRNDEWKIVMFNKSVSYGSEGTVTLDNIDDMNEEGEEKWEIVKVVEGNFEGVINTSIELIKKYRNQNEDNGE